MKTSRFTEQQIIHPSRSFGLHPQSGCAAAIKLNVLDTHPTFSLEG
jgi:hypothetical protein